jgi:hypothetical protein
VRAFLSALQAKDRDRLAEATALRSQSEQEGTSERNRELLGKILDQSISDSELDDLAKKFEGYQYAFDNAVKSTGRQTVAIRKPTDDGGYYSRTVTVRKEKKGWGVMDISEPTLFKGMGGRRTTGGRSR